MGGLPQDHCRSEPARDSGGSGDMVVEWSDAFASKPAPTGDWGLDRHGWFAAGPCVGASLQAPRVYSVIFEKLR
jgi:hypothetical protein